MKSVASFAFAVLSGLASANVAFTNTDYKVVAGQAFTLTWAGGAGGPYTINLKDGSSGNLKTVETLTSTSSESFTWSPPSSLTTDTYAFEIIDAADKTSGTNYSPQFQYSGSAATTSAASSSATSLTSSVSSSTSISVTSASSSSSAASSSVSSTSSSVSNSTMASTTLASRTSSASSTSSASKTSSAAASSSTAPSTNDARGNVPFLAPVLLIAGVAVAAF